MPFKVGIHKRVCVHVRALDQLWSVYVCGINIYAHTHFPGGRMSGPLIFCLLEIPFEVPFMSLS